MSEARWTIPTLSGNQIDLNLKAGEQCFIVGANGSGKSALLHYMKKIHTDARWITAHRQVWFDLRHGFYTTSEHQRQVNDTLYQENLKDEARSKDTHASHILSSVLSGLATKENAYNEEITSLVKNKNEHKAVEYSTHNPSPIDQINSLFKTANLPIALRKSSDNSFQATREKGEPYSIEKMSDGERSAMIIAAHVLSAEPETVFLIDEPERHLQRSIIVPFLSELFDIGLKEGHAFVISTHELTLPVAYPQARALILQSCNFNTESAMAWDAKLLASTSSQERVGSLPEELKMAILGSRENILFVEGDSSSLDYLLYTTLFPNITVVSKNGCKEVIQSVRVLRDIKDWHHVEVYGLIDRDDRNEKNVAELAKNNIFALDVYSVESLYYCLLGISAVAEYQAEDFDEDAQTLIAKARHKALDDLKKPEVREKLLRQKTYRRRNNAKPIPIIEHNSENTAGEIDVSSYLKANEDKYDNLVLAEDFDALVAGYPLKKDNVLNNIAKTLKCLDREHYARVLLRQLREDDELRCVFKKRLSPLTEQLETS